MDRRNLAKTLGIFNPIAWLVVLVVLVRVDAIGEEVAILEESDIWLLLLAAIVGLVTIVVSLAGRATDHEARSAVR
jgi:hypothetical protein